MSEVEIINGKVTGAAVWRETTGNALTRRTRDQKRRRARRADAELERVKDFAKKDPS